MSTTIDSLDIQIKTSAGSAAAEIDALATALGNLKKNSKLTTTVNNLEKLKKALDGLNGSSKSIRNVKKLSDSVSKLKGGVSGASSAVNGLSSANNNLNKSLQAGNVNLFAAIQNYQELFQAVNAVVGAVSNVVSQAMEWDGIQFRFGRAFGEDAEETYAYLQKVHDTMGLNLQELMQYSSMYGALLSGFGLSQDKVTTISVGLTELTYDLWAANNDVVKRYEDVATAVKSAITGEIEPIRNLGIAMTEASLQEFIDTTNLAGMSIEKMTEAQKSEVRYAAMVNAAMNQGIVGTYAREMNTAEGAVRSLSQSFKGLVQALGSLFIPLLQTVIPYITAFVEILTDAVFWVAKLFGIPMQEISWGDSTKGVGSLADGAKDAASGLDSAADAAKKLKNYTMGFDELNVIDPNSGSGGKNGSGGAGGAAGWGEGLDLDTLWDDTVFAQASKKVDELKQKVLGFLDKWKTELSIIGAALGVLGITKLLSGLGQALSWGDKFLDVMKTIGKIASTALTVTLQFMLQDELFGNFIEKGSWRDYILALVVGAIGTGILSSMWGSKGIIIGLAVTAAASFKAFFESEDKSSVESLTVLFTGLATSIGSVFGAWKLLAKTDVGAIFDLFKNKEHYGATIGNVLSAMFPKASNLLTTATTWVTTTLIPTVTSAISTGLTTIATALGVSTGWAVAIVAAIIAAIVGAIWVATHWDEVKEFFTKTVPDWFEGVSGAVKKWWSDFDLGETIRTAMGNVHDWFSGIRDDVTEYWDGVVQDIKDIDWAGLGYETGKKVGAAFKSAKEWFLGIKDAVAEFFTKDLPRFFKEDVPRFFKETIPQTIESIKNQWVTFWGEKVPEFLAEMVNFFFIELPVWSSEMKDIGVDIIMGILGGIEESWDAFWEGVKAWIDGFVQGFKDELEINSPSKVFDEIGVMIVTGLLNGISEKWEDVKKWFKTVVAPKLTKEYWLEKFDTIRVAIRTKLDEFKTAVIEKWNAVKSWYNSNVAPKFTKDYWVSKFSGFKEGFVSVIKNAMNAGIDKINSFINKVNAALRISWDAFSFKGVEIFPSGSFTLATIPTIARFENGGFIEDGLFTMNHGEIAGKFTNGKSVVANNEQIVAGISEGVYAAVVAAMSETQRGGEQPVVVYLDGKQIYSNVKRTESRRGVNLMGNQLGYVY